MTRGELLAYAIILLSIGLLLAAAFAPLPFRLDRELPPLPDPPPRE